MVLYVFRKCWLMWFSSADSISVLSVMVVVGQLSGSLGSVGISIWVMPLDCLGGGML